MRIIILLVQLLLFSGLALANPSGINLSGKITLQATNTALVANDVDFKIRVLSPDGCILYSEKFTNVDLSATAGVFNLTIGNGTALYNAWDATLGTANSKASLIKVFNNASVAIPSGLTQYPGEVCAGGAYTPADGDTRKVVIEFDPTGSDNSANYVALSPFHRIRSVPYAMLADKATDADKLGGVAAANYAKTADLAAAVPAAEADPNVEAFAKTAITGLTAGTCGAGKVLTYNGTSLECVTDSGGGGGGAIATNTVAGSVLVDTGSNVSLNLTTGALDVKDLAISKITGLQTALDDKIGFGAMPTPGCAAGEALSWSSLTDLFSCYAITVDTAHVSGFDAAVDARIAADTTKLPVAGGTMTGNINMSNNQLSNVGYVHLQNKAADPAGLVAGNEGFVWYNSTDKLIKYYNGTAIKALPGYAGTCADGEVLKWNNTSKVWACGVDAGASGGADATEIRGVTVNATAPTAGQFLKYVGTEWVATSMPVCTADQVMLFNGTGVATCTAISGLTNTAIAAAAGIARTKLASGTADHVLINDGSGVMSSEAQLAITRGGTGVGTAPTTDQLLIGNASNAYELKTLTAGTGVTISTAGSAITINATATAPADSAYDTKGVVGFQTDAATSGMVYSSAGIAKVNSGTGANQIVKLDGTGKLPAVDGSALTNVSDATKLPLAGGTMTGAIAMGGFNITNTGNIMMANSKVLGLSSNAADPGSPAVGQMWYNSTSNTIKYYDGAVKTLGVSGSGLQSLGGLTDNVQTFATSTAGATFGITSAAGVHTLNIPIATASKDGLLSQTDFATFNGKLGAVSNTAALADGKIWIGDGTGKAQEQTLSGDVTVSNAGVATLATVSIAKGGTGQTTKAAAFNALSPMTTKGDVTVHNGTDAVRLAVGADGKALVADAASAEGVKWGDIFATDLANITGLGIVQKTAAGTYVTLGTTAPLAVTAGNITLSPLVNADIAAAAAIARTKLASGTASHVLINDGSGVMSSEAQLAITRGGTGIGTAPTTDQMLIGNASSGYDLKTLTAGSGVTISTAGSAITINATATSPADSAYDTKGVVGFQTDATVSGMVYSSAGIAKVNTGTGPDQIVKLDGTSKLPAVDGSALTNVNDATKLPLAGGTMAGNIAMGGFNITNTGNIMMANSKVLGLSSNAADPGSPAVGQMWYNSTSNTIKYYDGAVKTLGVSGSGVQSLGGLTDNAQTFATSTAGPTFGITSATGVHTLNIPIATAAKDGLLSQTDFATFNGKLGAVSNTAPLADGKVWIGDGTGKAQEQTLSGDVTVSNTGVATLATVSIAKGGTGQTTKTAAFNALSPMTTKGDITVRNGTDAVRLGVGTNGQALVADSAAAEGVKWGDIFATDLANITGLGIVQKTAAGTYVTLGTTAPLAVTAGNIVLNPIADTNVAAGAAIARTKLANGTANRVLVNSAGGVMTDAAAITANRALISDANGIPTHSAVTDTELGYISGVTSSVQTQLTGKVSKAGDTMTGNLVMNAQKEVRFMDSGSTHYMGLRSPATVTADKTLTLPDGDGAAGQILKTDGAGNLGWVTGGVGDFKADGSVAMTGTLKLPVGTAALPSLTFTGDTNTGIYHSAADEVSISTGGTQRMVVDASGNVGIGTASPAGLLDVQGGAATGSTAGKGIRFVAQDGGPSGATGGDIILTPGAGSGGWPNGQVVIDVSGSTNNALKVTRSASDGYTPISASALVPSTNTFLGNSWNVDGNTALIGFEAKNGSGRFQDAYIGAVSVTGAGVYTPAIVFGQSTGAPSYAESMRLDQNRNLGIGTTTPGAKLDVKGAIRMSGATSGYTGFQPAAIAGSTVWTLPSADGTAGYVLKTDGAGNLGWVALPGASGDASYVAKGVVQFDASEATSGMTVASGVASVKRTTAALASTILQLDASSKAMVKGLDLKGTTSGSSVTLLSNANTGAYSLTLPAAQGGANTVLQNDGAGVLSWVTALTSVNSAAIVDGSIVDADINAAAAIARTKLANGTANHVLINDGSGVMSSEALLNVTRGGTGVGSYTANGLVMAGGTSTSPLASITCAATGRMLEWTGTTWGCSADFLSSGTPGSKVNYVLMTGGIASAGATVAAAGSDTNVSLLLSAKGTGQVQTNSVLNVNATYVERAPAGSAITGAGVSLPVTANILKVSLSGNATDTTLPACPTTAVDQTFSLTVKVTNAGTFTLGWASSPTITWDSGTIPDASSGAGAVSIYQFLCFHGESTWYGMQVFKQ